MAESQENPDPTSAEAQAEAARAKEAEAEAARAKEAEVAAREAEAARIEREQLIEAENELNKARNVKRTKKGEPLLSENMSDKEIDEFLADKKRVERAREWLKEKGTRDADFVKWLLEDQDRMRPDVLGRGAYEDDPFTYEIEKKRAQTRYGIDRNRTLSPAQKKGQHLAADIDAASAKFSGSTFPYVVGKVGRSVFDPTFAYSRVRGGSGFWSGRGMAGLAAGAFTAGTGVQTIANIMGMAGENPFTKKNSWLNFRTPKEGVGETLGSIFTEGIYSLYPATERTPDQKTALSLGLDDKDYKDFMDQVLAGRAMNPKTGISSQDLNERITGKGKAGELNFPEGYGKLEVLPDFQFGRRKDKDGKDLPADPQRLAKSKIQAQILYDMPAQEFYNRIVEMKEIKMKEQADREAAMAPGDRKTAKEKPVDQSVFPYPFITTREVKLGSGATANVRYRPFVYKSKGTSKAHIVNVPINLEDIKIAEEEDLRALRAPVSGFSDDMSIDFSE